MKAFLINIFWVLGVILGLDGGFRMLTTGLYTRKDLSLIIFITVTLITVSLCVALVYYKKERFQKKGFFVRLSGIIALIAANLIQFFSILTTSDMYMLFSN